MPTNHARTAGHTRNTTRYLNTNGIAVQQHFLCEALELLMRYGTLRVHSLAFALFPNRGIHAATAAAHRVIANATRLGYVESGDEPKSRFRFYALTRSGARYLREEGNVIWASPTTQLLKKLTRAHHREWTNLCSIAAMRRDLESYAESDYFGQPFRRELMQRFLAIPDALTFTEIANIATVVWHEVELSRRSGRGANRPPLKTDEKDLSGIGKFRQLVHTLRTLRYLTHNRTQYTLALYFHCATTTLRSILEKHLVAYAHDNGVACSGGPGAYWLPFEAKGMGRLEVRFAVLPANGRRIEAVWHDTDDLPWRGIDSEPDRAVNAGYNEQFIHVTDQHTTEVET